MNSELTPPKLLRTIQVLYGALILGITNFIFVLLVLLFLEIIPLSEIPEKYIFNMMGISALLMIVSFFGGKLILRNALDRAFKEHDLNEKLKKYRKGLLASGLLIDFSAFFSLAFFMGSNHIAFLVIGGLAIIIMAKNFPSKAKTIQQLQLNYSEQHKLTSETSIGNS